VQHIGLPKGESLLASGADCLMAGGGGSAGLSVRAFRFIADVAGMVNGFMATSALEAEWSKSADRVPAAL